MTCLTELTCAMHADGELSPDEARAVEHHLAGCARCRALVEAHRDENRTLAAAFRESPVGAPLEAVPARPAPARAGRRAGAWGLGLAALAGVSILVGRAGWPDLAGGPGADWVGLLVDLALFVARNAAGLERILTTLALLSMAGLAVAGGVYLGRSPSRAVAAIALGLAAAGCVGPAPAEAHEARSGMIVTVGAGETLDGTLVAAAETVRVDGTVDGDLIVAAARVDVRGTVRGDLVVAAGTVEVGGVVQGSAYVAAGAITVRGRVARGVYAAGRAIVIDPGARVGGDLTAAARGLALAGEVARGVSALAHEAELSGRVGRDVRFRGARLVVRAGAHLGGGLRADVARASDVSVDPGATVAGPVTTRVASRAAGWYMEPRTWFWAATGLFGAAFLGWLGLQVAPGLVLDSAARARRWGPSFGWGVAALVGTPVAIVVLALTLVGFPVAMVLLGLYLFVLYAAKIVVALALGRTLLRPRGDARRDALKAIVVGLILIALATALPVVGWPIWALVACIGAGALAWRLAQAAGIVRSSTA